MKADGSFITLKDGITQYELGGHKSRETIVLVPGFSVPYFIFDITFDFLVKSGFRVLRYNLFGRGYSDRPGRRYDIRLFVDQLKELLDALNLNRVNLVGLSMGGPITAAFIDQYPQYVCKYVLIGPAGARPIAPSWMLAALKLPGLGELLLGLFGSGNMVKSAASDFFDPQLVEQFQEKYKVQMQFKGFKRAILSTLRHGMLGSFLDVYRRVDQLHKPTLIFWGRQDTTVPFEHSAELTRAMPRAELKVIENCGHIPHYERPADVNPALLNFLSRNQSMPLE